MRRKRGMVLPITPRERQLGVKLMVFEQWELSHANADKVKWFARRKHLTILKEKNKVIHGKGAVVGKWKSSKIYVAYIPTKKLEAYNVHLKQKKD